MNESGNMRKSFSTIADFFIQMKKFLLSLLSIVCVFFTLSKAQTSAGNMMLGGQFSSKISRQEQLFIIDASPDFGLFVNDNLAVGGIIDFGIARYGETNKHNSLGISPIARYYPGKQKPARFFLQAEAGYQRVNISVGDIFIARSGLGAGAGAGLAYFFNQTVSLEGMVRIRGYRYTDTTSALQNSFRLGIQMYIPSHRIR